MLRDLFPETLLVQLVNGTPITTSTEIAKHFGKQHNNVLRAIKGLLERTKNPARRLNFEPSSYLNEQGKRQPQYLLNRDAFIFVVGGFIGEAADEWKWNFIDAFNTMEAELHARTARFAAALDQVRPSLRPAVQDAEAGLPRAATAARLGKSHRAVTYHRRVARSLGLLGAAA